MAASRSGGQTDALTASGTCCSKSKHISMICSGGRRFRYVFFEFDVLFGLDSSAGWDALSTEGNVSIFEVYAYEVELYLSHFEGEEPQGEEGS